MMHVCAMILLVAPIGFDDMVGTLDELLDERMVAQLADAAGLELWGAEFAPVARHLLEGMQARGWI